MNSVFDLFDALPRDIQGCVAWYFGPPPAPEYKPRKDYRSHESWNYVQFYQCYADPSCLRHPKSVVGIEQFNTTLTRKSFFALSVCYRHEKIAKRTMKVIYKWNIDDWLRFSEPTCVYKY